MLNHLLLRRSAASLLLWAALVIVAFMAVAAGLATTGEPARQPELSGTLNLLCTPQIL